MTTDYNLALGDPALTNPALKNVDPGCMIPSDLHLNDRAIRRSRCATPLHDRISGQHGTLIRQLHEMLRRQQQLHRAARAALRAGGIAGAYRLLGSATHAGAQRYRACAQFQFTTRG